MQSQTADRSSQGRVVFKDIGHLDKARSFDEIRNGIERMLDGDGIRNKVVPQAKVQSQLRPHSPLVLYITDGVDFVEVAIGIFLSGQGPKKYAVLRSWRNDCQCDASRAKEGGLSR